MANIHQLPTPLADTWEWQYDGNCRNYDPDVFFHPDGERGGPRRRRAENAKRICATCPVLDQCRAHALEVGEPYGVWGGLSEEERHAIITQTLIRKVS